MRKDKNFLRARKGSVAVVVGVAMPVIVGFCALGAEVMYWQFTQRFLQSAADAAAFSGAAQLAQGRSTYAATTAANDAAYETGLHATRADTPVINTPPASGDYTGDAKAVEVILVDRLPRLFTSIFISSDTVEVTARSVARTAGARPACVLALNKSANKAVSFAGSSTLELSGCDVASNSIASDAVDFQGATDVTTECVSAVGGVDGESGNLTLTDCASPFEGTRSFPDPFDDMPLPTAGACDYTLKTGLKVSPSSSSTVSPGTVCEGGTGVNVTIQGDITFNAGMYIFDGVNITVNSTASLSGTDVTLVFLNGAEIDINGGADVELSAPTDPSDPYQGILMYGDPSDTNIEHTLNGSSATSFNGALYFAGSDVVFSGNNNGAGNGCTLLVADEIEFTGNSFFGSDCTGYGLSAAETAQVILIVE